MLLAGHGVRVSSISGLVTSFRCTPSRLQKKLSFHATKQRYQGLYGCVTTAHIPITSGRIYYDFWTQVRRSAFPMESPFAPEESLLTPRNCTDPD